MSNVFGGQSLELSLFHFYKSNINSSIQKEGEVFSLSLIFNVLSVSPLEHIPVSSLYQTLNIPIITRIHLLALVHQKETFK